MFHSQKSVCKHVGIEGVVVVEVVALVVRHLSKISPSFLIAIATRFTERFLFLWPMNRMSRMRSISYAYIGFRIVAVLKITRIGTRVCIAGGGLVLGINDGPFAGDFSLLIYAELDVKMVWDGCQIERVLG
jgi:hypothetical protein